MVDYGQNDVFYILWLTMKSMGEIFDNLWLTMNITIVLFDILWLPMDRMMYLTLYG